MCDHKLYILFPLNALRLCCNFPGKLNNFFLSFFATAAPGKERLEVQFNPFCHLCGLHSSENRVRHMTFLERHKPINNLAATESTGPDEVMAPDSKGNAN